MLKKILSAITALSLVIGAGDLASSVPFGTTPITAAATEYCTYEKISYVKYSDHLELFKCPASLNGEIVIPTEIDGLPVTAICSSAFKRCSDVTSITIPDSVTYTGFGTFEECISLESITLPKNITYIGNGTFSRCTGLTSVTIPDSVTSIGESAFQECSALKSITIPYGVTEIKENTFYGCLDLASVTIPETITNIGKNAFNGSGITSLTIPESCEYISIGMNAFENSAIEKLTINCKADIDIYAFSECNSLLTAALCNAHVSRYVFSGCSSLKEMKFSGVTVLDTNCITDCPVLENIDFTDCELTSDNAFRRCPMLFNIDSLTVFDSNTGDFIPKKKEFIFRHFNGADEVGFINQYVTAQVDNVVSEYITEGMSDLQKVIAMHDWVCENTKYTEGNTQDRENHNDASVFMNEYTVCEGYARACNLLYNAAGIETYYVKSSDHVWNIVNVGGHYFHVDATWDDGDTISRDWFMKSDEEMKIAGGSHAAWELEAPSSLHSFQKNTLPECKNKMGDVNFDGIVDASDASDVLQAYASLSTNQATDIDRILADYNLDGFVDSSDASDILAVYAYNSTT